MSRRAEDFIADQLRGMDPQDPEHGVLTNVYGLLAAYNGLADQLKLTPEADPSILGVDFLGEPAVRNVEAYIKEHIGKDVTFVLDAHDTSYSARDLELAKKDGEIYVRRPRFMIQDGVETSVTVMTFRELFRGHPEEILFFSFRSEANDWYPGQEFANNPDEMTKTTALVGKTHLEDSTNKTSRQQDDLLKAHSKGLRAAGAGHSKTTRRTAMENVWDNMTYYINTGERRFDGVYDRTSSKTANGNHVGVGFLPKGLNLGSWHPDSPGPVLGAYEQR